MRKYELTIVLPGGISSAKKKSSEAKINKIIDTLKGKVGKVEDWGEKELAGKIGKATSGIFLHFPLELETSSLKALSAKLSQEEDVIRYLLVRKEK